MADNSTSAPASQPQQQQGIPVPEEIPLDDDPDEKRDVVNPPASPSGSARPDVFHLPALPDQPLAKNMRKKIKNTLKTISAEHPEFELTYDMMIGIRTVIGRVSNQPFKDQLDALDFAEESTLRMPQEGSTMTPAHRMRDFKFKDYAPKVFRNLRRRFNIEPIDYMMCVCGNFDYLEFISNAKSGQFFFYTHDRQFMIKTQTKAESKFMRSILPQYYKHVMENPNTFITRFYGMHRVKPHKSDEKHFIIMGSVFHTPLFVHEVFDLKGSTQGRSATEKEKQQLCPVLKDNDWTERKGKLKLGKVAGKLFIDQLRRDTQLLTSLNIMDYSLLLGVHYKQKPIPEQLQEDMSAEDEMKEADDLARRMSVRQRRQSNYGIKDNRASVTPSKAHLQDVFEVKSVNPDDAFGNDAELAPLTSGRGRSRSFGASEANAAVLAGGGVDSYFCRDQGGFSSADGDAIYFAGIIDILQEWDSVKKAEHFFKSIRYDPLSISAVEPVVYAERMVNFFNESIE